MVSWIRNKLGLDGAVAYTFFARLVNITASTGTVLLIVHFLSPIDQGYYYTLLSLVSLQMVFELGFSFVILQLAAHESVHLTLSMDGQIEGDAVAHARLASVLQLTVRWYLRAAIALAVILIPAGLLFFSLKVPAGPRPSIAGPVILAVLAVSVSFLMTPLYSFFEGCNQIRQVAFTHLCQATAVLVASWSAIISGHGLYASACVNFAVAFVGFIFLYRRRHLIRILLHHPVGDNGVSWQREIWPFQWKIAVSWICSYFTVQVLTPILFACNGPREAGRMGLSLSIVSYIPIITLPWVSTKAATFGRLIRLGNLEELDELFFRTLKQAMAVILLLVGSCFTGILLLQRFFPNMALRMEPPKIFVLLLLTSISSFIVQSLAVYLRAFKREPYLVQSLVISSLTLLGSLITASRWGSVAVAITYFILSGIVALFWATTTFRTLRNRQRNALACP